jgi:hypothetical protein
MTDDAMQFNLNFFPFPLAAIGLAASGDALSSNERREKTKRWMDAGAELIVSIMSLHSRDAIPMSSALRTPHASDGMPSHPRPTHCASMHALLHLCIRLLRSCHSYPIPVLGVISYRRTLDHPSGGALAALAEEVF